MEGNQGEEKIYLFQCVNRILMVIFIIKKGLKTTP